MSITNSTIAGNAVGVVFEESCGDVEIRNSIIAGNTAGDLVGGNCEVAADYSLIGQPGSLVIDASAPGSNIIGKAPLLGSLQDNGGATLTHALLSGSPAIDRGDPNFLPPPEFDQRGEGYPRVINGRIDMGAFEVQNSAVPTGIAWLRSLGDVNGDGSPEIAVVTQVGGKTLATVKNAAKGTLVSQFEFSAALHPVDVAVLEAFGLGDDGSASHLVLLGEEPARAETRNILKGKLFGSVAFSPKFTPLDLTVVPDQNGNGIPELAMLAQGSTKVEIRDAVTGDLANTLWFDPSFSPRQVITLPDINRNASAELGVVLGKRDAIDRMVIKDVRTQAWLKTLWQSGTYARFDLLQGDVVTDRNGNGQPEVAMLLHDHATGEIAVQVKDAASNASVATVVGYDRALTPLKLVPVTDLTGNAIEEYAVLARNPGNGEVTAEIREGRNSKLVSRIWFNEDCAPLDMVTLADISGNLAQELVVLGRCGSEGRLHAFIKDARTGAFLKRLDFD